MREYPGAAEGEPWDLEKVEEAGYAGVEACGGRGGGGEERCHGCGEDAGGSRGVVVAGGGGLDGRFWGAVGWDDEQGE